MKPEPKEKPQILTDLQKRYLIDSLRTIGVRPRSLNLLESQQILSIEAAEMITLAARADPEVAAIHDATWDRIIRNSKDPELLPKPKESRRGG